MLIEHLLRGSVESLDEFMRDVWQKKALHIPHNDPNWLRDIFQLYDVEELWYSALRSSDSTGGLLFFVDNGVKAERSLNPFFAFSCRTSVVVNRGDRFCARLYELCRQLETEEPKFPMACCNVYLTPPSAQSVPKHSDDRDVLLLQIFGEKEWTVYNDPIVLPYRDEELGKTTPVDDSQLTSKSTFQIRQGDVLYMPRGFVHEAKTHSTSSSLHITVALQTSDWDYGSMLAKSIQKALRTADLQRSRLCVPLKALSGDDDDTAVLDEVNKGMRSILEDLVAHPMLNDFRQVRGLFREHISVLQKDRDTSLALSSQAIPAPLLLSSLIMWNPSVELDGIEELTQTDPNVPRMTYIVHCSRPIPEERRDGTGSTHDRMKFGVTDEMLRCVQWLSKQVTGTPLRVGQIPMFDDLAKLSLAIVLINNMSCVRVS